MKKSSRKTQPKPKKFFSFTFLLAIPGNFLIGTVFSLSVLFISRSGQVPHEQAVAFFVGLSSFLMILCTSSIKRLRVFIHETKHAFVVLLTGNYLNDIHIANDTGHVDFELYGQNLKFGPIIALAPYFFPLFSLPALIACVSLQTTADAGLSLLLGATLAIDLATAWGDIQPWQTDFKQVIGGSFISLLYLIATHFAWSSTCILWAIGGNEGYLFAANLLLQLAQEIALEIRV